MVLLGFDPGGRNRFGWASLRIDESGMPVALKTGVCSTASTAVREAAEVTNSVPVAVGIDAPLFWVKEGDRKADASIRRLVCDALGKSGTVAHVNSLRGACLVQGVLAALQIAETWPSTKVTEAHPKALLRMHPECNKFLAAYLRDPSTEHQRDAALAAYAAWAAVARFPGWRDMVLDEAAPFFPGGHRVSYWFPCPLR
jgi:predicted nuclease with RNAse H fold